MFASQNPIFEFRGPFGVPIQIGPSILLLIIFFIDFSNGSRVLAFDLMYVLLLVASIYLHEVGHAWGCVVQNVPVRRIMLHGAGGFCERKRSATRTEQELIVAMGPIVNLALWAVASLIAPLIPDPEIAWVFETLAWINLWLALFNLAPVQPLDGGKLLHLALSRLLSPLWATRVAGAVGLSVALIFLPALLFSWWALGLMLFFLPSVPMHWQMVMGRTA